MTLSGQGDTIDVATLKSHHNLLDVAGRFTELDKHRSGPCPFCGGGEDRFWITKDGQHFECRKCGKKGDVIDFARTINPSFTFQEAAAWLNGKSLPPARPIKRAIQAIPVPRKDWQREASIILANYEQALVDPKTPDGLKYLHGRGVLLSTCQAFRVGHARGSIAMPHISASGELMAIKYRNLRDCSPKDRYKFHPGSRVHLFGAHMASASRAAFLVEGEINAMSIYQELQVHFDTPPDVLSFGCEAANMAGVADHLKACGYSKAFLWFDDEAKAQRARASLKSTVEVKAFQSPSDSNGKKLDANELLTRGHLVNILARMLA